jgi:hypothetical protein
LLFFCFVGSLAYQDISAIVVVAPVGADFPLAANIPHVQLETRGRDGLDVEALATTFEGEQGGIAMGGVSNGESESCDFLRFDGDVDRRQWGAKKERGVGCGVDMERREEGRRGKLKGGWN